MGDWEDEAEAIDVIDPESENESGEEDDVSYTSDGADSFSNGAELVSQLDEEEEDDLVVNSDDDETVDTDEEEDYVEKLSKDYINTHVQMFHPEIHIHNYEEVRNLTKIVRHRETGIITDPLHRTVPFLTKYEKTRVLGLRAKQINDGSDIYVEVAANIVDGYTIAEMELENKKIPFIIKRPIPNGSCEYWKLSDLELL